MGFRMVSVLSLKEKATQQVFKLPEKSFMTDPLNIIYDDFKHMITRL